MIKEISEKHREGLKTIIKRKRSASWFPAFWIPLAIILLVLGYDNAALIILFVFAVSNGVLVCIGC
jgi:hypothetical protein